MGPFVAVSRLGALLGALLLRALDREDVVLERDLHVREQRPHDPGLEAAGRRGAHRAGTPLRADLWHVRAELYPARDGGREQHQSELRARRFDRDASQGGEGEAAADRGAGRVEVTRNKASIASGRSVLRPYLLRRSRRRASTCEFGTAVAPACRAACSSSAWTCEPEASTGIPRRTSSSIRSVAPGPPSSRTARSQAPSSPG